MTKKEIIMAHDHQHIDTDNNNEQDVELRVEGMTCTNCARSVQKYLENQGLHDVYVNFATEEVKFKTIEGADIDPFVKGIQDIGYTVADTKIPSKKKGLAE